jgi:hypothetical protein
VSKLAEKVVCRELHMTTTFLRNAPKHILEGFIRLRPYPVTVPGLTPYRYTGDRIHDKTLLRTLYGRSTFLMTDYDKVLEIVGREGFGLEVDIEETNGEKHQVVAG